MMVMTLLSTIGQPANACQLEIERGLTELGVRMDVVFRPSDNKAVQAMVAAGATRIGSSSGVKIVQNGGTPGGPAAY